MHSQLARHYNAEGRTRFLAAGSSDSRMSTNERGPSDQKVHQGVGDLAITDAIPVGISVLAPDGTILYVKCLALDLIGLTLDEVKGKSHLERTCHPDDLDRIFVCLEPRGRDL